MRFCNTVPTGAILTVLILTFGPLSGAHFNPAVSMRSRSAANSWRNAGYYVGAQIVGAIIGVWAAHLMFELPLWQISFTHAREWPMAGGVSRDLRPAARDLGCVARTPGAVPYAVGLYITSAYWFTASTSFADPAVTIARSISDTFAGIAPAGAAAFILAQFAGMLVAVLLAGWFWPKTKSMGA